MSMQKILIASAAGIVAGTVIGLLTAPATGSETRKKIADTAEQLKKKILRMAGKAVSELDELKDVVQHQTEGLSEDVRARLLKLIDASKASYKNVVAEAND